MNPQKFNCKYGIGKVLCDYADGTIDPAVKRIFEKHLEGCEPCWAFMRTYSTTIRLTREIPAEEMPEEMRKRLRNFLKEQIGSP